MGVPKYFWELARGANAIEELQEAAQKLGQTSLDEDCEQFKLLWVQEASSENGESNSDDYIDVEIF